MGSGATAARTLLVDSEGCVGCAYREGGCRPLADGAVEIPDLTHRRLTQEMRRKKGLPLCDRCGQHHDDLGRFRCKRCGAVCCRVQASFRFLEDGLWHMRWDRDAGAFYSCGPCKRIDPSKLGSYKI